MTRCEEFLSNLKINLTTIHVSNEMENKMLKMFKKTQAIFKITEMLTSMWNYMGEKTLHIFMCTVFKCP